MATFALVDQYNVVRDINKIDNEFLAFNGEFPEAELSGQTMQAKLGLTPAGHRWLQCSFSGSFRGQYPRMGDVYDETTDVFRPEGSQ